MMWKIAVVVIFTVVNTVRAALFQDDVQVGECVCINTDNVKARLAAGYSPVVQVLDSGACGKVNSGGQTVDSYTSYQILYAGQLVWVAGNYLDIQPESMCASACPTSAKDKACTLLQKYNSGDLGLAMSHPSGKQDNAYAYNNIRDMCKGLRASRSNYSCSECKTGPAPGGSVCLTDKLLTYLITLVSKGKVYVTELAGACHSCTSKHYLGQAVDLRLSTRSQEYINTCKLMGGFGQNEGNHVHCQFS
ncbi:uncharacterized protein LOC106076586 [Biomphalaria glabrata]|uniref:Uncharacterized protein LOC106076586 n=1 Tax=Biomphalaria glabrata TaxID=6526 RepID=A0A9W2YX35_BIOGL|nr:uncharacterized protein LOC106076586 [Biomphalaria glabrata]